MESGGKWLRIIFNFLGGKWIRPVCRVTSDFYKTPLGTMNKKRLRTTELLNNNYL